MAERAALRNEYDKIESFFRGKCVGVEHRTVHRGMMTNELLDARERFADLRGKIADLEGQKDIARKHYDGLIKPLAAESDKLLMEIRTRMFDVDEDCYVLHDYEEGKVSYISKATLVMVLQRDMTGADRQKAIDFEESQDEDGDGED